MRPPVCLPVREAGAIRFRVKTSARNRIGSARDFGLCAAHQVGQQSGRSRRQVPSEVAFAAVDPQPGRAGGADIWAALGRYRAQSRPDAAGGECLRRCDLPIDCLDEGSQIVQPFAVEAIVGSGEFRRSYGTNAWSQRRGCSMMRIVDPGMLASRSWLGGTAIITSGRTRNWAGAPR